MSEIRVRMRVRGRVQGVYFRASTQQEAARLGLTGWVRNARDGSVELEAQGEPSQVDALAAWCRRGPPAARVDDVDLKTIEVVPSERGFSIRQ